MSGWRLLETGQVRMIRAKPSLWRSVTESFTFTRISEMILAIFLGCACMTFVVFPDILSIGNSFKLAYMPMVVIIHVVKLKAHKSVGENEDPFPWLSVGASVKMLVPPCSCKLSQRSSPKYEVMNAGISTKNSENSINNRRIPPKFALQITTRF